MSAADDLTRLVKRAPADKRLNSAAIPDAIRDKTGLERLQRAGLAAGTDVTVASTDGLFTFTVRVVA
jgi:hypothetical protein